MQVVIPMSGFGERFRRAGYTVPKPLIAIDGKPIIEHVVDMFPGETDFTFICNQEHLDTPEYRMRETLESIAPAGRIIGIAPHKLGPVNAVLQVAEILDPDKQTVVNYCDFTCLWDWNDFKAFVRDTDCDGALPAYKGFHPHSLGTTNYAYIREQDGWMLDIQEKQPFTDNRMNEFASSGTYYFRSGSLMKEAFEKTMKQNLNVGGEYYVSLTYKPLLDEKKAIAVYPLQHFMQWGTPEDVREYSEWSDSFRKLGEKFWAPPAQNGPVVIPMAGLGSRFSKEGYSTTKPLIPVSGKYMVLQALGCLPTPTTHAFVIRADMPAVDSFVHAIESSMENALVATVPALTEGQAVSAQIGLHSLNVHDQSQVVTFGACDFGMVYDSSQLGRLLVSDDWDVIIWTATDHASAIRHPEMFGWALSDDRGDISAISVKKPFEHPETDHVITGAFTFRSGELFDTGLAELRSQKQTVNGEYYIDSVVKVLLELGFKIKSFEVENFFSWGTPNDLRTFTYWQSCFHQWKSHPYSLETDFMVDQHDVSAIMSSFSSLIAPRPKPWAARGAS